MKPRHLTWLVTAAALSTALSATAQQTQPTGTDTEPGQTTQGSEGPQDRMGDTTRGTPPGDSSSPGQDAARDDDMGRPYDRDGSAEQPKKKKRSFWDRITGRNKHLDEDYRGDERRGMEPGETPTETRPQQP